MFDQETVALIRQAPALDGIDLDALPQLLTDAFATVVAARIRLRTGAPDTAGAEIDATVSLLTRLAATHEVLVAQLPDRDNRAAAAFVAGTAHQTRRLARSGVREASRITATTVSAEVSSSLLFLIAEAYPDAAEASKNITSNSPDSTLVERGLLSAIKALAGGRLREIVAEPVPERTASTSTERALEALQYLLLQGVRALADQLQRPEDTATGSTARGIFQQVKDLCIEELNDALGDGLSGYSVFSGPLHVANLLIAADRDLSGSALSHLPAPSGIDAAAWNQITQRMALSRPFLWRNHKEAIQEGFLERGRSAVISFPTGGGKSTLAELKIAAALISGEQVVFLAPTHALVSQTVKALQKTFKSATVFGDTDDDVTLSSINAQRDVVVTTPERCLALLAMQPEAFANLGLIVFDECHLLHARPGDRSRRGLDSMLCLLNLTLTAPTADLLLMSAMMENASELAGWIGEITGRECLILDLAWKPTRQARGCVVYEAARLDALRDELGKARLANPKQKSVPAKIMRELTAKPLGFFGLRQTWSTRASEDYALRTLLETEEPLGTSSGPSSWYLTPNGNHVSTAIAAGSVAAGMKTLVFVQSTTACGSCVRSFSQHLKPREVRLNEEEAAWRALAGC
ncbi:MAG: DEAD/DEAH box helicase [Gemmatimonadaceae bacterium]|uniref:DEAD/DEAH box helicase n=1 Tax=Gemmatimonas sp. UBA7669 TaxID=1946568 RepID=UPI0025BE05A0|nr:DEAD/DEAH box helicase [Gemmatimonas sp. UBA7669]MBX9854280.1 DEAD/DEAH box helicase [Gemmatimonadaceae bacterium]